MATLSEMNSPFGYRDFPFAYDQYASAMYQIFMDPGTLIFLDTNVLGVPFRMHSEARKGFYQILQKPIEQKRLFVPGWVCNEYFFNGVLHVKNSSQHGFSSDALSSIGSIPASKVVKRFVAEAASSQEMSDLGAKLGVTAERAAQALGEIFENCSNMIKSVGKDRDPDAIHQELLNHLEGCCLSLDFGEHLSILEDQAARRRANRIPPGLTDEDKGDQKRGNSAGNADGDLAIWLEILNRSGSLMRDSTTCYSNTLVICEEKKSDFFYSPMRRRIATTVSDPKTTVIGNDNPRLSLVDPRLVSEFEARMGHRNIGFVRIEHIVSALSTAASGPLDPEIRSFILAYQQQAAAQPGKPEKAAQATSESESDGGQEEERDQGSTDAPSVERIDETTGVGANQLRIPEAARDDEKAFASTHIGEPFSEIVRDLYTHNWYVQNPAIISLNSAELPTELGASFILGRAVLQAADGRAWRADRFLNDFDAWSTIATQSHQAFLAGAAFECCFDGAGVQREEFKSDYLPLLMTLMSMERWEPARDDFLAAVQTFRSRFYWLPDRLPPQVSVVVTINASVPADITSIRLAVDSQQSRELLGYSRNPVDTQIEFDENRVRRAIEQRMMVPSESISLTYLPGEPIDYAYYPRDKKLDVDAILGDGTAFQS